MIECERCNRGPAPSASSLPCPLAATPSTHLPPPTPTSLENAPNLTGSAFHKRWKVSADAQGWSLPGLCVLPLNLRWGFCEIFDVGNELHCTPMKERVLFLWTLLLFWVWNERRCSTCLSFQVGQMESILSLLFDGAIHWSMTETNKNESKPSNPKQEVRQVFFIGVVHWKADGLGEEGRLSSYGMVFRRETSESPQRNECRESVNSTSICGLVDFSGRYIHWWAEGRNKHQVGW